MYNHIPDTFHFGSLDLFMTARLSDKVSTLGEVLFIAQSDNTIRVDVERLLLQYRQSDYFTASIGRYHTWVGYYNTAFNKGEFLETTTDRPFMYAFDDEGGVLPMQDSWRERDRQDSFRKTGIELCGGGGQRPGLGNGCGAGAEQSGCK